MIVDRPLPQFVRDLVASPPHRGGNLNLWFYRVALKLYPYRTEDEILSLLRAATEGEPVPGPGKSSERSRILKLPPGHQVNRRGRPSQFHRGRL